MASLRPCPACGTPARIGGCPSCGATVLPSVTPSTAALLMGLAFTGACDIVEPQAKYGITTTPDDSASFVDDDADGYSEADGDCDDADPNRHPNNLEQLDDGVDSNCDGEDNT